jgi:hypothetical protein
VAILAAGEIRGTGSLDELSGAHSFSEQVCFEVNVPSSLGGVSGLLNTLFQSGDVADLQVVPIEATGRTHRITAKLPEQSQIDEAVDRLRASGISIVSLEAKRPTLEDTFMRLVHSEDEVTD